MLAPLFFSPLCCKQPSIESNETGVVEMSEPGTSASDYLFTAMGAGCAVVATLIFLWIGISIARMGHHGGTESHGESAEH